MILGLALLYVILAAIWGWSGWQIAVTVIIFAVIAEVIINQAARARKRRRFREALEMADRIMNGNPDN